MVLRIERSDRPLQLVDRYAGQVAGYKYLAAVLLHCGQVFMLTTPGSQVGLGIVGGVARYG